MDESVWQCNKNGGDTASVDGAEINAKVRLHIKALSPYWISLIQDADPSNNELCDNLGVSYAAAWRQIRRGALSLGMDHLRRTSTWLLSLVPAKEANEIEGHSLQSIWFGFICDWTAPPLLNAFSYLIRRLTKRECQHLQELIDGMKWSSDVFTGSMFADRIQSLREDSGTDVHNRVLKRISIHRNRERLIAMMDAMRTQSDLDELGEPINIQLLMTLSCASGVPLDYFCAIDYVTPLLSHIMISSDKQTQVPISNMDAGERKLIISFARCPRASQERILSLTLSSILRNIE